MTARTTVTIAATDAEGNPLSNRKVWITLQHGGAGGSVDDTVIADRTSIDLDVDGEGSVQLYPNSAITPAETYYTFLVEGSTPSAIRNIEVPSSPSTIAWSNDTYKVTDPNPPTVVPDPSTGTALYPLRRNSDGTAYEVGQIPGAAVTDLVSTLTTFAGQISDASAAAVTEGTNASPNRYWRGSPFGRKWAVHGDPGSSVQRYYEHTYPGSFQFPNGKATRVIGTVLSIADATFHEHFTQFRNSTGIDQDNIEDAAERQGDRIGPFLERCHTDTPFPVEAGEDATSRISLASLNGDTVANYGVQLGEVYDWLFVDITGSPWCKRVYARHGGAGDADLTITIDGEAIGYVLVGEKTGSGTKEIAHSTQPFKIGLGSDGIFLTNRVQVWDGLSGTTLGTAVFDFNADDATTGSGDITDGVSGTWVNNGSEVIDLTVDAFSLGGGGLSDGSVTTAKLSDEVQRALGTVVTLGADRASSSQTLANTTGLSFSVVNGRTYWIDGILFITGDNTGDLKLGITVPSGTLKIGAAGIGASSSSTPGATQTDDTITSSGDFVTLGTIGSKETAVALSGFFTASADGTFQIQHSRNSSTTTDTTIKAGSFLKYRSN